MTLPQLTPLEIHSGVVWGDRRRPAAQREDLSLGPPAEVLERLVLTALRDPPCHVLFSGGRDSSVILAAATRAARRHDLPLPVPLTAEYKAHPQTWETDWQLRTIEFLGLQDWRRLELDDELDLLGPTAREALERYGPYWPENAHSMLLLARSAGAGAILTGGGGDELFTPWDWRPPSLRSVARAPTARAAARGAAAALLPVPVFQRLVKQPWIHLDWLRPDALRLINQQVTITEPANPDWPTELRVLLNSRYLECVESTTGTFAAAAGVRLVEPFYDPRMVEAVIAASPSRGWTSRTAALKAFFGDLLPHDVLSRSTKAVFGQALWGPEAQSFAASWDGAGVDASIVDPDALRRQWARPEGPDARTYGCLQSAWVAAQAA